MMFLKPFSLNVCVQLSSDSIRPEMCRPRDLAAWALPPHPEQRSSTDTWFSVGGVSSASVFSKRLLAAAPSWSDLLLSSWCACSLCDSTPSEQEGGATPSDEGAGRVGGRARQARASSAARRARHAVQRRSACRMDCAACRRAASRTVVLRLASVASGHTLSVVGDEGTSLQPAEGNGCSDDRGRSKCASVWCDAAVFVSGDGGTSLQRAEGSECSDDGGRGVGWLVPACCASCEGAAGTAGEVVT